MKQRYKRVFLFLLVAVLLVCAGCSFDVEQYLRPPQTHGEQQAIQQALETYIRDSGQSDSRYTLCYPEEGEHTAAFIMCDETGHPVKDDTAEAALAVVFYATDTVSDSVHINLLRREEDEWVSVADTIGGVSAILQVAFGDLDGDGMAELVTGWNTYNSRDRRLVAFSIKKDLAALPGSRLYNRLFVGDMTARGHDSLVLLRVESGTVYATLEHIVDGALHTDGQVWLDSGIQQFTGMTLCRLADGVHGLYLDAIKDVDTAVTELLYVDKDGLHAPFCHQTSRINTVTARPVGFAMRDVDGDAQVEVPRCVPLAGYSLDDSLPDYAYRTDWMAWDYPTKEWSARMSTVLNAADGYMIMPDTLLRESWTTTYHTEEHLLTLYNAAQQKPLLRLRPITKTMPKGYTVLFEASDMYAGCAVWYDEQQLDMDAVRYMVARWEG